MGDRTTWTVSQMTDGELVSRRAEIERKLEWLAGDSPRRMLLRGVLDEIAAETQDRVQIRSLRGHGGTTLKASTAGRAVPCRPDISPSAAEPDPAGAGSGGYPSR